MSVDVTTEITIERPPGVVSVYACDPMNAPAWYHNIKSVEWKSEPLVHVGSRIAFVAEFLGKRLEYTYEIVEYEPGERFVMRASTAPFPLESMETVYTFTEDPAGHTRMTLRNHGAVAGVSKLMAPMFAAALRSANEKDLAKLKEILEGH